MPSNPDCNETKYDFEHPSLMEDLSRHSRYRVPKLVRSSLQLEKVAKVRTENC